MHHMSFIKKYLIILFLLISYPAFADITGVSGTVSNGQSITILGSGFGANGPSVLVFDDFERGTNGESLSLNLANVGVWDGIQTSANSEYSSSNKISGNLAARFDSYNFPPNAHPNIYVDAPVPFNSFYISWWGLIPSGDIFPGCGYGGCNWKTIWVNSITGSVNEGDVTVSAGGPSGWAIFGNSYPLGEGYWLKESYPSLVDVDLPNGTWHRFQFYVKGRSDSTGEERIWLTTSSGNTRLVMNRSKQTVDPANIDMRQRFYVNGYVRPTPNSHPTFDDVYIAYGENAQARVEIGNADTYTGCSSLTMCTPTSWGDSSIVCTVRQGNLPAGDAWIYITDANGNRTSGYRVTMGSGGTSDQFPSLFFTEPVTTSNYSMVGASEQEVIILEGMASDDNDVQMVTFFADNGQNGNVNTENGFATWSVPVSVNKNETVVVTITATDDAGQSTSKTMTITCTSPVGWDATVQTADSSWTDSSVTYCVRLLVRGDSISESASQVVLGFQGRSSGDYTIRNVSIAERDTDGNEGDVFDDTWTQVTFENTDWNSSVTVSPGVEKLSDPTTLNLQPGTDYYVTFKIDSPSVYLDPPTGYRELYFDSADHTSDIDWSTNGFRVTQDYHALSKIYVYTPASAGDGGDILDTIPPAPPIGLGVGMH